MNKRACISALLLLFPFAGACSDPKEATKDNFEDAINAELQHEGACITIRRGFPQDLTDKQARKPAFDALVRHGLLSAQRVDEASGYWLGGKAPPATRYDVTADGAKLLRDGRKGGSFFAADAYLCFGKPQVAEIGNFTAPADRLGSISSSVTYTYEVDDVASWARDPAVAALEPAVTALAAGKALHGNANLILTNDGWMHSEGVARMLRQPPALRPERMLPSDEYTTIKLPGPAVPAATPAAPPTKAVASAPPPTATAPAPTIERAAAAAAPGPSAASTTPAPPTTPAAAAPTAPSPSVPTAIARKHRTTSPRGTGTPDSAPARELENIELPRPRPETTAAAEPQPYRTPDGRLIIPAPAP